MTRRRSFQGVTDAERARALPQWRGLAQAVQFGRPIEGVARRAIADQALAAMNHWPMPSAEPRFRICLVLASTAYAWGRQQSASDYVALELEQMMRRAAGLVLMLMAALDGPEPEPVPPPAPAEPPALPFRADIDG